MPVKSQHSYPTNTWWYNSYVSCRVWGIFILKHIAVDLKFKFKWMPCIVSGNPCPKTIVSKNTFYKCLKCSVSCLIYQCMPMLPFSLLQDALVAASAAWPCDTKGLETLWRLPSHPWVQRHTQTWVCSPQPAAQVLQSSKPQKRSEIENKSSYFQKIVIIVVGELFLGPLL